MTVRVRLVAGKAEAVAELDTAGSPDAARAFVGALPLEGVLLGSMWSGNACELELPQALRAHAGTGHATVDVPVGELAIAPTVSGAVLLIAYGPVMTHMATGPVPATRLGRLVEGQDAFLRGLERTFDVGAIPVRVSTER